MDQRRALLLARTTAAEWILVKIPGDAARTRIYPTARGMAVSQRRSQRIHACKESCRKEAIDEVRHWFSLLKGESCDVQ